MDIALHFPKNSQASSGTYRLLELPPDLVALLQADPQREQQWTIRGQSTDDAVLCTESKTYTIRCVTLSNAICVLTPPLDQESGEAVIRESVHEILELQPTIPKLHRLRTLLRCREYDDVVEQMDIDEDNVSGQSMAKSACYSYENIRAQIQASDAEFDCGLRERRILAIKGELRPITPAYLNVVLELLINTLVALSQRPESASVTEMVHVLSVDHDISRNVSLQVMSWFGEVQGVRGDDHSAAKWKMDVESVVRQMGLGRLDIHRAEPLDRDEFVRQWRMSVGESFEGRVDLSLLAGNYVSVQPNNLKYFPSSDLPSTPADRFTELFLAQIRWKKPDIVAFLRDITLDDKECEKLLIKFARATIDSDGVVWYTSRGGTVA